MTYNRVTVKNPPLNLNTLDRTFPTPAENLACDEALLDWCECGLAAAPIPDRGGGKGRLSSPSEVGGQPFDFAPDRRLRRPAVLRFWESTEHFVVVGYSNRVATEVDVEACARRGVPILRRCSGGGAVVQGPGCLNYALVLPIGFACGVGRGEAGDAAARPLASVAGTNRFIMERHREVIQGVVDTCGLHEVRKPIITFDGHTDLALDGRKFSGNSQRRRRHYLLFHGTFLLGFDLALIGELLRFPSKSPAYRRGRVHAEFLCNLQRPAAVVKEALRQCWDATEPLAAPADRVQQLVADKYRTRAWNEKF